MRIGNIVGNPTVVPIAGSFVPEKKRTGTLCLLKTSYRRCTSCLRSPSPRSGGGDLCNNFPDVVAYEQPCAEDVTRDGPPDGQRVAVATGQEEDEHG